MYHLASANTLLVKSRILMLAVKTPINREANMVGTYMSSVAVITLATKKNFIAYPQVMPQNALKRASNFCCCCCYLLN